MEEQFFIITNNLTNLTRLYKKIVFNNLFKTNTQHETLKNIPNKRFIKEPGWLTFDSSPASNNWIVKEKIMKVDYHN